MSRTPATDLPDGLLEPGEPVEVLGSFDGSWSSGFEVAEVLGGPPNWTYRIRRTSDGAVRPRNFDLRDVLPLGSAAENWMVRS